MVLIHNIVWNDTHTHSFWFLYSSNILSLNMRVMKITACWYSILIAAIPTIFGNFWISCSFYMMVLNVWRIVSKYQMNLREIRCRSQCCLSTVDLDMGFATIEFDLNDWKQQGIRCVPSDLWQGYLGSSFPNKSELCLYNSFLLNNFSAII